MQCVIILSHNEHKRMHEGHEVLCTIDRFNNKTLHNGGLCIFTESIFLFPMTGHPAITTSCILPMTIYPTMITTGLRPVSRHFNIPVAVPCPFRAYPNCTTVGCGAGGTDRNPYAKYGFRPYKLRICSKNGKAKQHYCYKNYLFHSVVFNFRF